MSSLNDKLAILALDSIIRNIGDGVIILDAWKKVVQINPAAQRITGITAKDTIGKKADVLPSWLGLEKSLDPNVDTEENSVYAGNVAKSNYSVLALRMASKEIPFSGWVVFLRDVSDLQIRLKHLRVDLLKTDVEGYVKEILSSINLPESVKVKTSIPTKLAMNIDTDLMWRVFKKIFTNAVQAMPNGGTLTIKATETKSNVEISVKDTGAGMTVEEVKNILKPVLSSHEKIDGTGLILSKRIVEAHKGTLDVQSEPGKGTTVTIKLPNY